MTVRRSRQVPRRGLRRPEAAEYVGVSPGKFDEWVLTGRMPPPIRIDNIVLWDVMALDEAFDRLMEPASVGVDDDGGWGD